MEFEMGDVVSCEQGQGNVIGVDSKGLTVLFVGFRLWFSNESQNELTLVFRSEQWECHDF